MKFKINKKAKNTVLLLAVFIGISAYSFMDTTNSSLIKKEATPKSEIQYTQFIDKLNAKQVKEVNLNNNSQFMDGEFTDGKKFITDNPQTSDFKKYLLEHGVKVNIETSSSKDFLKAFSGLVVNILLGVAMIWILTSILSKQITKGQQTIGTKSITAVKKSDITFDDVAGNEEAKEDMMELVEFLKNPVKYKSYGATIPKGTILEGPPGTGKTLLAKALAGTANVPYIAMAGSDFVEKFVGVGAARIRNLFETAKQNAPCIVFIDEIDAVGKQRGPSMGNDEREQTLNQLLVEMDGFSGTEGVIIIAATNRAEMLDNALLRSGRFDRRIMVELPDVDARHEILKVHSKNKPLSKEVDLREVAKMTTYMSGADLANLMNESSIYAARFNHKGVTMADIDRALNKIIAGEEKKNRKNITRRDKEVTAFHEAGHTVVAKLLTKKVVPKVTIIPTTKGAGGYTLINHEEKMFETKAEMINEIAIALGGRIAEEVIFGEEHITGGASQDLKMVTRTVVRMIKDYGMSKKIGILNIKELYGDSYNGSTNDIVAAEAKEIVEKIYNDTKDVVNSNKSILCNMAKILIAKETLFESEIDEIMSGKITTGMSEKNTLLKKDTILAQEVEAI